MRTWLLLLLIGAAFLRFFGVLVVKGQDNSEPAVLLITEIFYDTPGDDTLEEWVELANVGAEPILLSDIKIGDEETARDGEGMLRFPESAVIEPGQVIVLAQTAVGFQQLFGFVPDFEIVDSDTAVPDMRGFPMWSGKNFGLANDGDEILLLDAKNKILDAVNYGESVTFFEPSIGDVFRGQSVERAPASCDTNTAADWQPLENPTPGTISFDGVCQAAQQVEAARETVLPIGEIQGSGDISDYVNQEVTFRGVVTGVFADQNAAGIVYHTIFVQDLPGESDANAATSDGIAVFVGRERPSIEIGNQLLVKGKVTEYFGLTEIEDENLEITVEAQNATLPEPLVVNPPADNAAQAAYFEPFESMLVTTGDAAQVVGPTYTGCGLAIVAGAAGQNEAQLRIFRHQLEDAVGQIIPVLHNTDVACGDFPNVKSGDVISGLAGPLTYNFDQFKIVQQDPLALQVTAVSVAPIPAAPTLEPDQFSVATFNVENYFDSFDDTRSSAEPKPGLDEIARKQVKIAYALGNVLGCPTLVGVQEIEKAGLLADLAEKAAEYCDFSYTVTHLESVDARGIDLALLSNPRRVQVNNVELRQACFGAETGIFDRSIKCEPGDDPLFSRPPLQVDLSIDGASHVLIVNHFKSKRGGEAETTTRRLAQAAHINGIVEEQLSQNPQARLIVLGDFNDYDLSPAMLAMTENGRLTNVLQQIPEAERYSYVFSGASQLIDGILVSPALAEAVTTVTIQHVNADYPASLADDMTPENLVFRSSDHDLPLAIFVLPETETSETATPAPTRIPEPAENDPTNVWPWMLGGLGLVALAGAAWFIYRRT